MKKKKLNKVIIKIGGSEFIRIYDICSIICLSIFANIAVSMLHDQSQSKESSSVELLLFFLFEGVGLTLLYSLYSKCHQRTLDRVRDETTNFETPNYDRIYLDSVESEARLFKLYWTIVILPLIVCLITFVYHYIFVLKEWFLKLLSTSCN